MQILIRNLTGQVEAVDTEEVLSAFAPSHFNVTSLGLFEADEGAKKKKRKKKNFVSKKRVPHQRKKEKLKLLKLFKIGKDGSVEATRTECPHCKGSFMAKHKDGRLYCGACYYTKTK